MRYGIPYIGSKNGIAQDIVNVLPSGERLVDLFCGGCSVTHCGMMSGKWKKFLANDIDASMPQLFLCAIEGKYRDDTRWISREDFFRLKDKDPFVRTVWSFGNKGDAYIYGKPLEPYKRACHYAVVFDEWMQFNQLCPEFADNAKNALDGMTASTWIERKARRLKFCEAMSEDMKIIREHDERIVRHPLYSSIIKSSILQNMVRLERLQSMEDMSGKQMLDLTISSLSYENVPIHSGDVVYADPPYENTGANYGMEFDHAKFWDWVSARDFPVYVSEYNAPEGFVEIFSKQKPKLGKGGNSSKNGKAVEKVYVHEKWKRILGG